MDAIIDIERRHPRSEPFPLSRIFAETKPHLLKMPDGLPIEVLALIPQKVHTAAERAFIESTFPFFHRRIIPTSERPAPSIGGYLLSPIPGRNDKDRFDAYFSSAEAILESRCGDPWLRS